MCQTLSAVCTSQHHTTGYFWHGRKQTGTQTLNSGSIMILLIADRLPNWKPQIYKFPFTTPRILFGWALPTHHWRLGLSTVWMDTEVRPGQRTKPWQIAKTGVLSSSAQAPAFNPAAPSVFCPRPSPKTIHKQVNHSRHRCCRTTGTPAYSSASGTFGGLVQTHASATNLRRRGVSEADPAYILLVWQTCHVCIVGFWHAARTWCACCLAEPQARASVMKPCSQWLPSCTSPRMVHMATYFCTDCHPSQPECLLGTMYTQHTVQATIATNEKVRYILFVRAGGSKPLLRHAAKTTCLQSDSSSSERLDISLWSRWSAAVSSWSCCNISGWMLFLLFAQARQSSSWSWQFLLRQKNTKYSSSVTACEETVWKHICLLWELDCLGFCLHSFLRCFEALSLPKSAVHQIRSEASNTALHSSPVLFLRRGLSTWVCQATLYWIQLTSSCFFLLFLCLFSHFCLAPLETRDNSFRIQACMQHSFALWFLQLSDVHHTQCVLQLLRASFWNKLSQPSRFCLFYSLLRGLNDVCAGRQLVDFSLSHWLLDHLTPERKM